MSISVQPVNQNLLQGSKFKLNFTRLPFLTFFCTGVNIPGVSVDEVARDTPFVDLTVPADKIKYDHLEVSFLIDEDFQSWECVHNWIRGMTFPTNFHEYKDLNYTYKSQKLKNIIKEFPQYSDAQITVFTNKNNSNFRLKFVECFPVSLSSVKLSAADSADVVLTAEATFKYSYFDIERV